MTTAQSSSRTDGHHQSLRPRIGRAWLDHLQDRGEHGCVAVLEECLDRITDSQQEGSRTFLSTTPDSARALAQASDMFRRWGQSPSRISGMPVSIKDLLDIKGQTTRAGSKALDDSPPATVDAPVVRRLKRAGAALVGRTNMTLFAYSVVGLNADFGTPGNPWDSTRIPGGSSSGAAVSVARGMSVGAIGSDTVGSIRVPAALCGCVGLKPTQDRVPLDGAIPLSPSLDSIGPLAGTVALCADLFGVMSNEARELRPSSLRGIRVALPSRLFLDDLDTRVAAAFERAQTRLSLAGATLVGDALESLVEAHRSGAYRVIQSAEAYAWHRELLERRGADYDPRIKARIEKGASIGAADYVSTLSKRRQLMDAHDRLAAAFDVVIFPTVPFIAPTFAESDAEEDRVRTTLLRNAAPINFLNLCAVSIPMHEPGSAPIGLQIVGHRGEDWRLLELAAAIESILPY